MGEYIKTAEVAERLTVARSTLDAFIAATPPHIEIPRFDVSAGKHRHWRWIPGDNDENLLRWVREVNAWQASERESRAAGDGRSGGGTPTARSGSGSAPRKRTRKRSGGT